MKQINVAKIGIIVVFILVGIMFFVMGYQIGVECYNAVTR